MGRFLTLIKIIFIRTRHFTLGCESNGSILLCISSCKLDKSWSVQPGVNGIPSHIRLAIASARLDVCGASDSTWFDMFIESTCVCGMGIVKVAERELV